MRTLDRREILKAAAISLLTASSARASSPDADLSGVTLRAATFKGENRALLRATGLDNTPYRLQWVEFNTGAQQLEAITADAVDFGTGSEMSGVFAARGNSVVKFIAVNHLDLNNQCTFVQGNSSISSVADLRGKRVGYVRGATPHYFLYKQLAEVGLSFKDIDAKNLSPADGYSAFATGQIDAWSIWGYNRELARNKLGARVLKSSRGYLSGNFLVYGNPRAIDEPRRHAALADFLLRFKKAYQISNADYAPYAKAQSDESHVPVEALQEMFRNRSNDNSLDAVTDAAIAGQQEVADTVYKIGVIDAPIDMRPWWDRSFDRALNS